MAELIRLEVTGILDHKKSRLLHELVSTVILSGTMSERALLESLNLFEKSI